MPTTPINLGDEVKDTVTGFSGIAVCRAEWLHGCVRFVVQPQGVDKSGKMFENASFDEPQLKVIKRAKVTGTPPVAAPTGGPAPVPHARPHVSR